ncbi:unnamed protein product [Ambrosiozyma monospora]|uniref:Unnamed protein product n=1 Tax=Ambrosiozyma monospora TaxID=43982 RepID=A0A9W6Z080_AMBMO|nr:unnamed protein product [Ambrosiozyma monospora]
MVHLPNFPLDMIDTGIQREKDLIGSLRQDAFSLQKQLKELQQQLMAEREKGNSAAEKEKQIQIESEKQKHKQLQDELEKQQQKQLELELERQRLLQENHEKESERLHETENQRLRAIEEGRKQFEIRQRSEFERLEKIAAEKNKQFEEENQRLKQLKKDADSESKTIIDEFETVNQQPQQQPVLTMQEVIERERVKLRQLEEEWEKQQELERQKKEEEERLLKEKQERLLKEEQEREAKLAKEEEEKVKAAKEIAAAAANDLKSKQIKRKRSKRGKNNGDLELQEDGSLIHLTMQSSNISQILLKTKSGDTIALDVEPYLVRKPSKAQMRSPSPVSEIAESEYGDEDMYASQFTRFSSSVNRRSFVPPESSKSQSIISLSPSIEQPHIQTQSPTVNESAVRNIMPSPTQAQHSNQISDAPQESSVPEIETQIESVNITRTPPNLEKSLSPIVDSTNDFMVQGATTSLPCKDEISTETARLAQNKVSNSIFNQDLESQTHRNSAYSDFFSNEDVGGPPTPINNPDNAPVLTPIQESSRSSFEHGTSSHGNADISTSARPVPVNTHSVVSQTVDEQSVVKPPVPTSIGSYVSEPKSNPDTFSIFGALPASRVAPDQRVTADAGNSYTLGDLSASAVPLASGATPTSNREMAVGSPIMFNDTPVLGSPSITRGQALSGVASPSIVASMSDAPSDGSSTVKVPSVGDISAASTVRSASIASVAPSAIRSPAIGSAGVNPPGQVLSSALIVPSGPAVSSGLDIQSRSVVASNSRAPSVVPACVVPSDKQASIPSYAASSNNQSVAAAVSFTGAASATGTILNHLCICHRCPICCSISIYFWCPICF